jgi:ATP-binding cassette subfamily F protein uup
VLIVSHDREFLDEVVTSSLVFEGDGKIGDYVGGYTDWQNDKAKQAAALALKGGSRPLDGLSGSGKNLPGGQVPPAKGKKLSGKEQKELEGLPAKIEILEKEQAELTAKLGDPSFYKTEAAKFSEVKKRLDVLEREHAVAFARWETLEAVRNAGG